MRVSTMTKQEIILAIKDLIDGNPVKNDEIYRLLQIHNCDHLLLKSSNPDYMHLTQLHCTINNIQIIERYKACQQIFEQNEFNYAIIKGAVLSKMIYGDPSIRCSGDIDMLINKTNVDYVKSFLNSIGFVQGKVIDNCFVPSTREEIIFQTCQTHQLASFVKKTDNPLCPYICLDVNTNVVWGENENKVDMNYVLSFVETTNLFGFSFNKLCPEMELVSLCLHHYKDMNSLFLLTNGSLKFCLYYEIYMYLHNVHIDEHLLRNICETINVGQYLYACIYQVQSIFYDTVIEKYIDILSPFKDPILLNTYGLNEKERKTWTIDLLDRLFNVNLPIYIREHLSEDEIRKIEINRLLM